MVGVSGKAAVRLQSADFVPRMFLLRKTFVSQRNLRTKKPSYDVSVHRDWKTGPYFSDGRSFQEKQHQQQQQQQQRRPISLLHKTVLTSSTDKNVRSDLDHAIDIVRKYDPSGYLPGLLIGTKKEAKMGYFATRAFWVETGLRFVKTDSDKTYDSWNRQVVGTGGTASSVEFSANDRVNLWHERIDQLYEKGGDESHHHPTIRLLQHLIYGLGVDLSKKHFQSILQARQMDIDTKQYATVDTLLYHARLSCGSLMNLTLESSGIYLPPKHQKSPNSVYYNIGNDISTMHGISNMLRMSVPTLSSTGKIVIPADLCQKYGVKSPRYLLSALGMGDVECRNQFQLAVKELVELARFHHQRARSQHIPRQNHNAATSCFLPGLAAETFLNRLQHHNYDLTDRKLRNVGYIEHASCAYKLILASITQTY